MEGQQQQQCSSVIAGKKRKKSMVSEFLEQENKKTKMSLSAIRMKIAKVMNDKDKSYNNMLKGKERAAKAMEKFRELEATYEFHSEELKNLQELLKNEHDRMDVDNSG